MPNATRLVVIGASAGGLPVLQEVLGAMPADFPAPVCVVLHIGSHVSLLPEILTRRGPLAARHVVDGESLRPGVIYAALRELIGATRGA